VTLIKPSTHENVQRGLPLLLSPVLLLLPMSCHSICLLFTTTMN